MNRHDSLVLYFCVANLTLENIYSGGNFCGKNVCINFYLWELIFADLWKNRKNKNPQKFLATRYLLLLNPFAPGDFAEKRVLKLGEWFSGHCRAIKS